MDIKSYLYNIGYGLNTVKTLADELQRIKKEIECYSRVADANSNEYKEIIKRYEAYKEAIETHMYKIMIIRVEAFETLQNVEPFLLQTIILKHYFLLRSWEEIAREENFTLRHIHNLKDEALKKFQDCIEFHSKHNIK